MKQSSKSKNARVGGTARALAALLALSAFLLLSAPYASAGPDKPVTHFVMADAAGANNGTSWADAFSDIQDALDAAAPGDQIWVAAGTYTPSARINGSADPRTASFILKSGVEIYGGFQGDEGQLKKRQLDPGLTVLSGDMGVEGDDTDNSYHVVYANGVTGAVLDGFTVTGGRGEGASPDVDANRQGAGMCNLNSALTVANCIFRDNRVARKSYFQRGWGGGMFNYCSATIVTNCTFSDNRAGYQANQAYGWGAGMYNYGYFGSGGDRSCPVITGCTFSDNVAFSRNDPGYDGGGGGGMANDSCSPPVDRCTFTGNLAGCGGAMLNHVAMPLITNCIFNENSAIFGDGQGGAIYNLGYTTIMNCTFHRNGTRPYGNANGANTEYGGAIFEMRVGSVIYNCIFSENAARHGGGAVNGAGTLLPTKLTNCLFYKNILWNWVDPIQENNFRDHPVVIDSLYGLDPLFVNAAEGDFHLRYDSPCLEAGFYQKFAQYYWPQWLPTIDFDGGKRIIDGDGDGAPGIDIGADEYAPKLSDLGVFLQALADDAQIDKATATSLLAYVADAQAALDQDDIDNAKKIVDALIRKINALDENEITEMILMRAEVVLGAL